MFKPKKKSPMSSLAAPGFAAMKEKGRGKFYGKDEPGDKKKSKKGNPFGNK